MLKQLKSQLNIALLMVTLEADAAQIADKQFRLEHGKLKEVGVKTEDVGPRMAGRTHG